MKVLLLKDVYKLGRAGDVKRVADGFGRNFLLPQNLAVLATPGALKKVDTIRATANTRRSELNKELGGLSDKIAGLTLYFPSKAGETGKLYGSITTQMIGDALSAKVGTTIDRRQIEVQPIRVLGEHKAHVRLTVDLTPELKVVVHREGESPAPVAPAVVEAPIEEEEVAPVAEEQAAE
jgi:large subunit ribosomal protein L9